MRNKITILVILELIVAICVVVFLLWNQNATKYPEVNESFYKFLSENTSQINENNLKGWFYKNESNPEYTIIYFQGSEESATNAMYRFYLNYMDLNDSLICCDYPGKGVQEGKFDDVSLQEMAVAVYDYIEANNSNSKVILVGYSMGTYPATYLAASRNVEKLVLIAPFDNYRNLYDSRGLTFQSALLKNQFKTDIYATKVDAPTLVISSYNDNNIKYILSESISKEFKNLHEFRIFDGLAHNEYGNSDKVQKVIKEFISQNNEE